jgi:hypothetical protein
MPANKLAASFPKSIPCPEPLQKLYDYEKKLGKHQTISGFFETSLHDDQSIKLWFGNDGPVGHLAEFGSTGGSGFFCVWLRPDGKMPIVHMGSEGDHNTVLAENAEDFLRLLAVGYQDLGFDNLSLPPSPMEDQPPEEFNGPNPAFREWVLNNFGGTIPQTGVHIVSKAIANSDDFQAWIDEYLENEPAPKPKLRPISLDDITTLLGHPVHEASFSPPIKALNLKPELKVNHTTQSVMMQLTSQGLEAIASTDTTIHTLLLFNGSEKPYGRYPGKLPESLHFDLSKQAARNSLIGTPTQVGQSLPLWDRYDRKDYALHITYANDGSSIKKITLMRPDVAP